MVHGNPVYSHGITYVLFIGGAYVHQCLAIRMINSFVG